MNKYTLIRQKRDQAIAKRQTKQSRRTFPRSIFQLNSIIDPEVVPPDIITEEEVIIIEPLVEPIQEPIIEPLEKIEPIVEPLEIKEPTILLPENQLETENAIIETPIEIKPDVVDLVILSQTEDIRKLLLLKETIKRFSKKKIV